MRIRKYTFLPLLFAVLLLLLSCGLTALADEADEPETMTATIMPFESLTYTGQPQKLLDESTLHAVANGTDILELQITYSAEQNGEYSVQQPEFSDAGTYTVYYRIEADGYEPVLGHHTVSIDKKPVSLVWSLADDGFSRTDDSFSRAYDGNTFTAPTAALDSESVEVLLTSGPDEACIAVGDYVFQALPGDNYAVTNPTCTVSITGQSIEGFLLNGNPDLWYDGVPHLPAVLTVGTPPAAVVTYSWSDDNGATWKETGLMQMSAFTKTGRYLIMADVIKDGYYPIRLTAEFRIKAAKYQVESSDFVTGWDLVLAYTNDENVSFTYDGMQMYDVSALGYRYGTTASEGGRAYSFVYGCLVKGTADQTKVVSCNAPAGDIGYIEGQPCDINGSGSVDLYDLVAAQAVYNVNEEVLSTHMDTALKADANRDKKVDTNDAAYIKSIHA